MLALLTTGFLLAATLKADRALPDDPGRDPLAPAAAGMVQCYDPDTASHTCRLIAAYRPAIDGTWTKIATLLPDPTQHMTVMIESPVAVRDGAVCGTFRRDQVLGAKLFFFDRPIPADRALPVLAQIADALAGAFDREICTRFVTTGGVLVARPVVTGAQGTPADQRVIWVRSDAGFHVEPRGNGNGG
jgi:hypothetical protein